MSIQKVNARPAFRLSEVKVPGKTQLEKRKFRAIVTHRNTRDTEQVIQEMLDRSGHHMSVGMVESVVKDLLDTMIKLTLDDGATRRFGDYFAVRLDIRGSFNEQDSMFDPRKHEVKLSLVPLKKFRVKSRTKPPQNVKKQPRAYIAEIRSETAGASEIKIGEDIIITGRDLGFCNKNDYIRLMTHDEHLNKVTALFFRENIKEHSDTRIVVPYPQEFKDITLHARSSYRHVFVSINSSGGKKGAKTRVVKCSRSHLPVILGGRD